MRGPGSTFARAGETRDRTGPGACAGAGCAGLGSRAGVGAAATGSGGGVGSVLRAAGVGALGAAATCSASPRAAAPRVNHHAATADMQSTTNAKRATVGARALRCVTPDS